MTTPTDNNAILLVDDEQQVLFSSQVVISGICTNKIITLDDSCKVMPLLETGDVALIVLDLHMPGITGQELLSQITYRYPRIPVVIMTASNTVEIAVECMKNGAFDYLVKPVKSGDLVKSVTRALEMKALRDELNSLKNHLITGALANEEIFARIVTRSSKMRSLFHYLESISNSQQPLLFSGETGVGKELFARAAHALCGCSGPFVPLNAAGLDDLMFSDTLFGHRKGAFTNADQAREGLIAKAAGGTLFLDEIGDLNAANQVKLLRLLQEREYYPLGADVAMQNSARIMLATNSELQKCVTEGSFRNDLYYRINVHQCHIPPLRERLEDIPLLVQHFITEAATALQKVEPEYSEELFAMLSAYSFPGNVRELQTMIHDAVAQNSASELPLEIFGNKLCHAVTENDIHQKPETADHPDSIKLEFDTFPTLKEMEERLISQALAMAKGNQSAAASFLGMTRQAFNNRIKRKKE